MRSSSTSCEGCLSKFGLYMIGILHLISAPLLWQYLDHPYYDHNQWSPFLIMLMPISILLLIGITHRVMEYVFAFVCLHFVIILMLIGHIIYISITTSALRFIYKDVNLIFLCEIFATFLMIYFFTVIFKLYEELLLERFTSLLSVDDSTNNKQAMKIEDILKNFDYEQPMKKNSDKEMIIQCENSKKSMA